MSTMRAALRAAVGAQELVRSSRRAIEHKANLGVPLDITVIGVGSKVLVQVDVQGTKWRQGIIIDDANGYVVQYSNGSAVKLRNQTYVMQQLTWNTIYTPGQPLLVQSEEAADVWRQAVCYAVEYIDGSVQYTVVVGVEGEHWAWQKASRLNRMFSGGPTTSDADGQQYYLASFEGAPVETVMPKRLRNGLSWVRVKGAAIAPGLLVDVDGAPREAVPGATTPSARTPAVSIVQQAAARFDANANGSLNLSETRRLRKACGISEPLTVERFAAAFGGALELSDAGLAITCGAAEGTAEFGRNLECSVSRLVLVQPKSRLEDREALAPRDGDPTWAKRLAVLSSIYTLFTLAADGTLQEQAGAVTDAVRAALLKGAALSADVVASLSKVVAKAAEVAPGLLAHLAESIEGVLLAVKSLAPVVLQALRTGWAEALQAATALAVAAGPPLKYPQAG